MAKSIGADRKRSTANLPSAVGAELTHRRVEKGWTQQHLADLLGYDVKYIRQIEQAEKSPTLTTLMALSGAFELPLSELIKSAEVRVANTNPKSK